MAIEDYFLPPDDGFQFTVGKPTKIEWDANTNGRVSLWLRHSNGPAQSTIAIAENIKNTGEYTWTPTPDTEPPSGLDSDSYTLLIGPGDGDVDDSTNQVLITIRGSKSSSAATDKTVSTTSSASTTNTQSALSSTSTEDSPVTLTVTAPGGSGLTTTLETLSGPSATSTGPPQPSGDPGAGGLSSAQKAGIGVGIGIGVPFILALLVMIFRNRRKQQSSLATSENEEEKPQQPSPMHEVPHEGRARHEISGKERFELSAKERLEIGEAHEMPAGEMRIELEANGKVPD